MSRIWLMKNEPSEFSVEDLEEQGIGCWDGIRNFQARNLMKEMKVGDKAYFYYSSCPEPGIYAIISIAREYEPDKLALDRKSPYYYPRATEENNPWVCVHVKLEKKYRKPLLLPRIREMPLGECRLTMRGNRLSLFPLTSEQDQIIEEELEKLNNETEESESSKVASSSS
jgi:predicted RNA-binding protein with PUA-like domain